MTPTRIAFWPNTTDVSVASYRIRCAQIRDGLAARGIPTSLYRPRGRFAAASPVPDLLVLVKRTRDADLAAALELGRLHGTRLVLDLCDNIFFGGDTEDAARLGGVLGGFDAIVTPSGFLRDAVAAHVPTGMRLPVIPDAVEAEPTPSPVARLIAAPAFLRLSRLRAELAASGVAEGRRLIWFGISGTRKSRNGLYDLAAFSDMLARHDARAPVSLTIVSDSRAKYRELFAGAGFRVRYLDWNFWTFNHCLRLHDIAVLPVRRNDYNWAKSANRLTTAFANGVAVAASAIPSYQPFHDSALLDDWDEGLARLMDAKPERLARIAAARGTIEADYTLAAASAKWASLLAGLSHTRHWTAAATGP